MTDQDVLDLLVAKGIPHATLREKKGVKYFGIGIMEMALTDDDTSETVAAKIDAFKQFMQWANAAALIPPEVP